MQTVKISTGSETEIRITCMKRIIQDNNNNKNNNKKLN